MSIHTQRKSDFAAYLFHGRTIVSEKKLSRFRNKNDLDLDLNSSRIP